METRGQFVFDWDRLFAIRLFGERLWTFKATKRNVTDQYIFNGTTGCLIDSKQRVRCTLRASKDTLVELLSDRCGQFATIKSSLFSYLKLPIDDVFVDSNTHQIIIQGNRVKGPTWTFEAKSHSKAPPTLASMYLYYRNKRYLQLYV